MLEFTIYTLVDITATGQYRLETGKESLRYQQQNFEMLLQAISLRALPFWDQKPSYQEIDTKKMLFGSKFKGKHTVWTFSFRVEREDAYKEQDHDYVLLLRDLNMVPFIPDLNETAKFQKHVFDTIDPDYKNTVIFQQQSL